MIISVSHKRLSEDLTVLVMTTKISLLAMSFNVKRHVMKTNFAKLGLLLFPGKMNILAVVG
jgi:hypothetical protein